MVSRYMSSERYHRLKHSEDIDNPDQRLTDDINTFTQTTLFVRLILLNSVITWWRFQGLWDHGTCYH